MSIEHKKFFILAERNRLSQEERNAVLHSIRTKYQIESPAKQIVCRRESCKNMVSVPADTLFDYQRYCLECAEQIIQERKAKATLIESNDDSTEEDRRAFLLWFACSVITGLVIVLAIWLK